MSLRSNHRLGQFTVSNTQPKIAISTNKPQTIFRYGAYSGIVYDHAEFPLLVENAEHRPHRPCIIAGPTCDSGDIVCRDQPLPDLEVGDLVLAPTMGAYSSASACGFNGLDIPRYVEVE